MIGRATERNFTPHHLFVHGDAGAVYVDVVPVVLDAEVRTFRDLHAAGINRWIFQGTSQYIRF